MNMFSFVILDFVRNLLEQQSPGYLTEDWERVPGSQSGGRGGVLDPVRGAWKGSAITGGDRGCGAPGLPPWAVRV